MDQKLDNQTWIRFIQSPIGTLELKHNTHSVQSLSFPKDESHCHFQGNKDPYGEYIQKQIESYFKGELHRFDIKLDQEGTDFQQKVWMELLAIPYGQMISYSNLAQKMGNELLTRAVATANSKNKILILIPCHRVIGKDGKLTGYSGGMDRKRWLLNHESNHFKNKLLLF